MRDKERIITHTPGKLEWALSRLSTLRDGVLVSPCIQEGLDLKGDNARFQVITKLFFPNLGSKRVRIRAEMRPPMYNGRDWINRTTAIKISQAYGRIIRGLEDFGITWILDGCFPSFWKSNKKLLTSYFREGVIMNPHDWKPSPKIRSLFSGAINV